MKTTLLTALRADAQSWWYHQKLRREGNKAEALRRERESVRSNLKVIRTARLAVIGHGGSTIHMAGGVRQTWDWEMPIIRHLDCPVVDLRTIPTKELVSFVVRGPIVNVDIAEDEGTTSFDYVTAKTYVQLAKAAGAEVRNA